MSAFEDVLRNICKVVAPDGALRGTAFFVLPDGHALTCHHVVFGLSEINVQLPDESAPRSAEYDAQHSNPEADIAVLRVSGAPRPGLQLGRCRPAQLAYGSGFRPGAISAEPQGHTFPGRLSPGQALRIRPSPETRAKLDAIGDSAKKAWNQLPDEYRTGTVFNFDQVQGVRRGISGGPVYDPELRRVTGMFRAVEGDDLAYVLSLDSVFDCGWPELEQDNERDVHESALDRLWLRFGVKLVAAGATPAMPPVEDHLDAVLRDYALFGGRARELRTLIDFPRSDEGGYFFITGPPLGFGKTALMVALARILLQDPGSAAVVHFLNRKYQRWLDVESCLDNLCKQLMRAHALGGPVPNTENGLRALYKDLLKLAAPPEQRIVVLLDGLDETIGVWNADADLFPPDLPSNVKVIFSAQSVADRDWLNYLGLKLPAHRIQTIERLEASDVSDILAQAGIATSDPANAAERLFKLSGGDAFHLVELLQDLRDADGDLTRLSDSPFSEYLRAWWDEAGEDAFYDLMGMLAVAVAPLCADALASVNPDDALKGKNIGRVLRSAARYISGNHDEGYQLKHARIRRFVVNTMPDEIGGYQKALTDFCLRWREAGGSERATRYVLEYGVRQLIEAKQPALVTDLLSAEFIAAKWNRFGSLRGYIQDLSLAAASRYREQRMNAPQALGLVIARQSVRDVISSVPPAVFAAWIRRGEVERALTTADDLTEAHGAASAHLMAMAQELCGAEHAGRSLGARTHFDIGASLLQRALGLIPIIRLLRSRYESFERLVRIAATAPGSTPQLKLRLAQQASKWGGSIVDPIERGFVMGLASYLFAAGGDKPAAEEAYRSADEAGARIARASDRLAVFCYRMQAIQVLFPGELDARFSGFEGATDRETTFPLAILDIFGVLVHQLAEIGPAGESLLQKLASQIASDITNRGRHARQVVTALLQVGAVDDAIALIGRAYELSAGALAEILDGIERLPPLHNGSDRPWWPEARRRAAPQALGAAGDWGAALDRLRAMRARDRATALRAVMRAIDSEPGMSAVPPMVWGALTDLIETVPQARVECLAEAALAASRSGGDADGLLDRAVRQVFTESKEGGTERFQSLYAVALHQDNRHAEAAEAASRIGPLDIAAETLIALADYSATNAAAIELYGNALLDCLTRAEDPRRLDYYDRVAAAALRFARAHRDSGRALYDRIAGRVKTPDEIAIDLAVTGCAIDPHTGWEKCLALVAAIANLPAREQARRLSALLSGLAGVTPVPPAGAEPLLQMIDALTKGIDLPASSELRWETAKASLLVRYSPDEGIQRLRRTLATLAVPRQKSPVEWAAIKFMVDAGGALTNGPVGYKLDEANDALAVWSATILAVDARPDDAIAQLRGVLDVVRSLGSPADESTALKRIFAGAAELTQAQRAAIGGSLDQALEQAASIADRDYQAMALHSAVRAFVATGDFARAERAATLMRAVERHPMDRAVVTEAARRTAPLSPVEQQLTKLVPANDVAFFIAYYPPADGDDWPFANSLIEGMLAESTPFDTRLSRNDLLDVVLSYACCLHRIGGANMIATIAQTIEDFDARFEAAGAIIASASPNTEAMPADHSVSL